MAQGLGSLPVTTPVCLQGGATGKLGVLALRVCVRAKHQGAAGDTEGDLGERENGSRTKDHVLVCVPTYGIGSKRRVNSHTRSWSDQRSGTHGTTTQGEGEKHEDRRPSAIASSNGSQ